MGKVTDIFEVKFSKLVKDINARMDEAIEAAETEEEKAELAERAAQYFEELLSKLQEIARKCHK